MGTAVNVFSYAIAAIVYLGVVAIILPSRPNTRQALSLLAALGVGAVWAGGLALALRATGGFAQWMLIADGVHATAWVLLVASLLMLSADARRLAAMLGLSALLLCTLIVVGIVLETPGNPPNSGQSLALVMLGLPLIGLLGLEQLFRNSVFEQRPVLRPLCLGIGIVFTIDVFVFSQALLFSRINEVLWSLRGFANAAAAPLLLYAVKQQPGWGRDVFVSRHVVFYTTSLVAAGLYLLAMAAGGYLITLTEVAWGPLLQAVFFACAGAALLYAIFSVSLRRRLKVFIAKHFYRNQYDYREEWLRLIQTLAGSGDEALSERAVRALADIIEAQHGRMWVLDRDAHRFEPHGAWRIGMPEHALVADNPLVRFMVATNWVIDTREYQAQPEKYSHALETATAHLAEPTIFVPVVLAGELLGIVALDRPVGLGELTYEDHDLLKTAGQQVAIYVEQERAQEALAETRQFEAFSRLTAFLMHDLKNLIAQQELVVRNAQRFKHRPEFIDDAIRTIESSVERMRRVLERLQGAAKREPPSFVDLAPALKEVCAACADRTPEPQFTAESESLRVAVDRDRLCMAVTNAIRNAQDATPSDGRITLRLSQSNGLVSIEVTDTGSGMDADFVRTQLFKPFQSTKGVKGMGIGAYQIRETIRASGGDVEVQSEIGAGTTFTMWLPLAAGARAGQSAA